MPWFSNSSPFDADVEKATAETNVGEDWGKILDICDKVTTQQNGPKDCLRAIVTRINNAVPHVSLQALMLLDACVNNCGKVFHLEVCSRDFESEIKKIVTGKQTHPKIAEKMKQLLKKWAEGEFKSDSQLSLIPSLYSKLKSEGVDFTIQETPKKTQIQFSKDPNVVHSQQEEDDIAKAIALSIQENQHSPKSGSLYPSTTFSSPDPSLKEFKKVRAIYDFDAAEDNELTFKAGEVIHVLDDGDSNWWKGTNQRGEGLFPANFVTSDLTAEPEQTKVERKSVQFNEQVQVKTVHVEPKDVEIDESKINSLLQLLHDADPCGETPDTEEMLLSEEQCTAMGPLIDLKLEKIDKKHATLTNLSQEFMQALVMYHGLMRDEPPPYALAVPKYTSMPHQYAVAPTMDTQQQVPATHVVGAPMPHLFRHPTGDAAAPGPVPSLGAMSPTDQPQLASQHVIVGPRVQHVPQVHNQPSNFQYARFPISPPMINQPIYGPPPENGMPVSYPVNSFPQPCYVTSESRHSQQLL